MYISSYINNVQNNSHFISIVLKSIKYCEIFRHAAERRRCNCLCIRKENMAGPDNDSDGNTLTCQIKCQVTVN